MKMKELSPRWQSLGHSALVLCYITAVAWLMSNVEQVLGPGPDKPFFTPIAVLMLFVLSASVMGSLVFARPVLMYLDGKKREAVLFLGYTIGWLTLMTFLAFLVLVIV